MPLIHQVCLILQQENLPTCLDREWEQCRPAQPHSQVTLVGQGINHNERSIGVFYTTIIADQAVSTNVWLRHHWSVHVVRTWASQFFPRLASPPCEERCRGKSWTPLPAPRSPGDFSFDSFSFGECHSGFVIVLSVFELWVAIAFLFWDCHLAVVSGLLIGDGDCFLFVVWPHSWQSSLPSPAASPVPRGCIESPQFEPSLQSLSHAANTIYEELI